jgi:hypothetical protein
MPANIVEIRGKEMPLNFPIAGVTRPSVSQPIDGVDDIDPEILEMLDEEAEDGFGDGGDLDDDFVNLAGGVDMPEGRRVFEEFRRTAGAQLSDSEIDDEDELSDIPEEMADEGRILVVYLPITNL